MQQNATTIPPLLTRYQKGRIIDFQQIKSAFPNLLIYFYMLIYMRKEILHLLNDSIRDILS